jgi:hypothetical protein
MEIRLYPAEKRFSIIGDVTTKELQEMIITYNLGDWTLVPHIETKTVTVKEKGNDYWTQPLPYTKPWNPFDGITPMFPTTPTIPNPIWYTTSVLETLKGSILDAMKVQDLAGQDPNTVYHKPV